MSDYDQGSSQNFDSNFKQGQVKLKGTQMYAINQISCIVFIKTDQKSELTISLQPDEN